MLSSTQKSLYRHLESHVVWRNSKNRNLVGVLPIRLKLKPSYKFCSILWMRIAPPYWTWTATSSLIYIQPNPSYRPVLELRSGSVPGKSSSFRTLTLRRKLPTESSRYPKIEKVGIISGKSQWSHNFPQPEDRHLERQVNPRTVSTQFRLP